MKEIKLITYQWTSDLSVGNAFIDGDHQKLFDMANRLHVAMSEGRGKDVLSKVLSNLIIYTREHFKREEEFMLQGGYAGYAEHKVEHDKLLKTVLDLQQQFEAGTLTLSIKVSGFVNDWLMNHITKMDKQLAWALK